MEDVSILQPFCVIIYMTVYNDNSAETRQSNRLEWSNIYTVKATYPF